MFHAVQPSIHARPFIPTSPSTRHHQAPCEIMVCSSLSTPPRPRHKPLPTPQVACCSKVHNHQLKSFHVPCSAAQHPCQALHPHQRLHRAAVQRPEHPPQHVLGCPALCAGQRCLPAVPSSFRQEQAFQGLTLDVAGCCGGVGELEGLHASAARPAASGDPQAAISLFERQSSVAVVELLNRIPAVPQSFK